MNIIIYMYTHMNEQWTINKELWTFMNINQQKTLKIHPWFYPALWLPTPPPPAALLGGPPCGCFFDGRRLEGSAWGAAMGRRTWRKIPSVMALPLGRKEPSPSSSSSENQKNNPRRHNPLGFGSYFETSPSWNEGWRWVPQDLTQQNIPRLLMILHLPGLVN